MKQVALYALLVIYLLPVLAPQALEEVFKLPALLEHYAQHRVQEPAVGWWEFVVQHYGQPYRQHQQAHDHSNLPGKGDHQHTCWVQSLSVGQCLPPNLDFLPLAATFWPMSQELHPAQIALLRPSYAATIWQPPRITPGNGPVRAKRG